MGGGGGGSRSQQVTSQVTQTNLPAYVQPYFENILQRGLFESARPYQPFTGQRMAQFAPEETAAQRGVAGLSRPGQLQMATDIASRYGAPDAPSAYNLAQGFNPQGINVGYRATQFSPGYQAGQFAGSFAPGSLTDPGAISSYMSPYQQAVTDIEKREAARLSNMERMNIGSQAARYGAVGGNRSAILEAERQRNLAQQMGDIQTRGSQSAFDRAVSAYEADRNARLAGANFGLGAFQAQEAARQQQGAFGLQAQQLGDQAMQAQQQFMTQAQLADIENQKARAALGMEGLASDRGQGIASAELLAGLGTSQQQLDLERLGALGAVGQQRRALMQQGLDFGYEDFLRQQAYGRDQLGFMSNLLQGVPVTPGSTSASFGRVPTAEQQLLGSGLGALGLYQAFRQPGR